MRLEKEPEPSFDEEGRASSEEAKKTEPAPAQPGLSY